MTFAFMAAGVGGLLARAAVVLGAVGVVSELKAVPIGPGPVLPAA